MRRFQLSVAEAVGAEVEEWIRPACTRALIVGSVRREVQLVHDLDIIAIPKRYPDLFGDAVGESQLDRMLVDLYASDQIHIKANGPKNKRFVHTVSGIPVDLYLAQDISEWWPLLVIRTGSAGFNKKLCALAIRHGFRIHVDGHGIEKAGTDERVEIKSEKGFFAKLGLRWLPPKERTDVAVLQVR